jgi:hypothetical protein
MCNKLPDLLHSRSVFHTYLGEQCNIMPERRLSKEMESSNAPPGIKWPREKFGHEENL